MNIMSCMKKQSRIIIGSCFTIFILSISIFAIIQSIKRKDNSYYYLPIMKNYYLINERKNLTIDVYSNHQNDEYLQKVNIERGFIEDMNSKDYYEIRIIDIDEKDNVIRYENTLYYHYLIYIELPIENCQYIQLENAKLVLDFPTQEKREFKIGTIIIDEDENTPFFNIVNLKGVVNTIEGIQVLKGIGLSLNKANDDYTRILSIESLDKRIKVDCKGIYHLIDNEYDNEMDVDEFKKRDFTHCFLEYPFVIEHTTKHYFIELNYDKWMMIPTLGFKLTYERAGFIYKQYIMPFQFFNSSSQTIEQVKYETNSY